MLFNSFQFVTFFLLFWPAYWLARGRVRMVLLLLASYVFYGAWDYRFLALLLATTTIDFGAGIAIDRATDPRRRKLFLLVSLCTNLGVLGFFKYCNFFVDSLRTLLLELGINAHLGTLDIILPVGVSFYTFQSMSYTIDVYRRRVSATTDFLGFATFIAFFPQLLAGPIERFERLYPQVIHPRPLDADFLRRGLFLLLQGYVKKVAIADSIAPIVDVAFRQPHALSGGALLEGALLFTCQIYCDFSGYSDIARGLANLLGVELMENFRTPLLSRSLTEFWRRWHIGLSSWLRDYLYIPLGGNRHGAWKTYRNLMLTMLLGGLWHGADWKFVIWGGLHGAALATERRFAWLRSSDDELPTRATLPMDLLHMCTTFLVVVAIFVFFRATSTECALLMLERIVTAGDLGAALTVRLAVVTTAVVLLDLPLYLTGLQTWALRWPVVPRAVLYACLALALIVFSGANQAQTFIYFAF